MTGDFNTEMKDIPYLEITDVNNLLHLTDSHNVAEVVYGLAWTGHNFGLIPMEKRYFIDYLFIRGPRYGVLAEMEGNEFLSDYAPAMIGITLK